MDEVISRAVAEDLDKMSFSRVDNVASLLASIGIGPGLVKPYARDLEAMMQRRHHIAHRADRDVNAKGIGRLRPIDVPSVHQWCRNARNLRQICFDISGAALMRLRE